MKKMNGSSFIECCGECEHFESHSSHEWCGKGDFTIKYGDGEFQNGFSKDCPLDDIMSVDEWKEMKAIQIAEKTRYSWLNLKCSVCKESLTIRVCCPEGHQITGHTRCPECGMYVSF